MKKHFFPEEQSMITYQDKCNWFGEKELTFNEIEQQAKQRKEAVKVALSINPYRNIVIEEVSQHVEERFGQDCAAYIRELKK